MLDAAFRFSHLLGTFGFLAPLVLAAALVERGRGRPREARLWLLLGCSTWLLQAGLKALVARERPRLFEWLVDADSAAFPSGHALAAATLYPLLAWTLARCRPERARAAWTAAVALALFVGLGRLYLGVHWPTDVAFGWALGAAQLALALRVHGVSERPRSPGSRG